MIGVLLIVVAVLLAVFGAVARSLATDELKGAVVERGRHQLRKASERLPDADRERWREEWLGEYEELLKRPLTALLWAYDIRRNVRRHADALGMAVEPHSRRERRQARLEAQRQRRVAWVEQALTGGELDQVVDRILTDTSQPIARRIVMLGTVARVGNARLGAVASVVADTAVARLSNGPAQRLGTAAGRAVGALIRWEQKLEQALDRVTEAIVQIESVRRPLVALNGFAKWVFQQGPLTLLASAAGGGLMAVLIRLW